MIKGKILISFVILLKINLIKSIYVLIDKIYRSIDIQEPQCYYKNLNFPQYRGKIYNIEEIIINEKDYKNNTNIINKTKFEEYPVVYLPNNNQLFKYIDLFPESTIYFTTFQVDYNKLKKYICYIRIEDWSTYKFYYIINAEIKLGYITFPLIFGFFFATCFCVNRYDRSNVRLVFYRQIYFYKFAHNLTFYSIGIVLSTITIYYFLLSYIIYSLYKTYIIINLMFLLEGFSTIHFNDCSKIYKKYFLIFFLFDSLTSIFSEYIVYFIPYLDNFYLLHLKSIIEHITFLIIIFIFFKTKYIHLYRQYLLENRLRTILSLSYKKKTVIYLKIMIFSIIYCCAFIIMPFIEKIYIKIDNVTECFYLNYFIIICMELFFCIIIALILTPEDLTLFFFLPIIFDYNRFKLETKIKEDNENSLNISNITQDLLKNEYEGKQYPLIFINPFGKTNNVFSELHVGLIKKTKTN